MARVPYINNTDMSPETRSLVAGNIHRAIAHSPKGLLAFRGLGLFIRNQARLDPRLREMAILQIGYVTKTAYEYAHHIKIGRDFGVSDDDVRAIADETAGRPTKLDPLAKAVLRAAREMTLSVSASDETFAALKERLDNERLVELVITISFYVGVVRLLQTLQVDLEDEYRELLKQFPFEKK